MIKHILVHLAGDDSDCAALDTAYLLARAHEAHLACVHPRPNALELAIGSSSLDSDMLGPAAANLWITLEKQSEARAANARATFDLLCAKQKLPILEQPAGPPSMSACYREPDGGLARNLMSLVRNCDIAVFARSEPGASLDINTVGEILIGAGRPLLLTPAQSAQSLGKTVAIAWKESAEAARAVHEAIPILMKASGVVILTTAEGAMDGDAALASAKSVSESLRWHGIDAQTQYVHRESKSIPVAICSAADSLGADLLVMGGYGHSRTRELVFGGFTRAVLHEARLPVLLAH